MTLSSTATKVSYDGDGSTTEFAINFVFWDTDDLRVIHRGSDGTETLWARGTHYTVSGGSGGTGTLAVKTAPTDYTPVAGESLLIKDAQAETQGDSLPLSGAFPSTVVEQRLDRLTRLIQIHSEEIARSILLPETASVSGLTIPEPGAGELVRYNPAGTGLETVRVGDLGLGVDTLLTGLSTDDLLRWDAAQSAWVNLKPGSTGLSLLQDETAAAARTEMGLGTASLLDAGLGDGNVPVMNATGYPAADGSQINNVPLPRGYIDGLILANNATDAANDIDIGPGAARDGGNAANLDLAGTITKRLDAAWAVGSNAGGLDTGTKAIDSWYHVWLIRRSDTGAVDALFSLSATAPAMPANYYRKRRIGSILTDGSGNILPFFQRGDRFQWVTRIEDFNAATSTTASLITLSVPTGISVEVLIMASLSSASGNSAILTSPSEADVSPNTVFGISPATSVHQNATRNRMEVITDTSAQIRIRSNSASPTVMIETLGWLDSRGRNE